jgi:hypothetical protein
MQMAQTYFGRRATSAEQAVIRQEVRMRLGWEQDMHPGTLFVHDHQDPRQNVNWIKLDIIKDVFRFLFFINSQPQSSQETATFDKFVLYKPRLGEMAARGAQMSKSRGKSSPVDHWLLRLLGCRKGDSVQLKDFAAISEDTFLQHYQYTRTPIK